MPPVETNCPSCEARLRIRREAAGKQVRCPKCQTAFVAPDDTVQLVPDSPRPLQPTVFVSHANEDRPFVEKTIKPLMQDHGIRAWWSAESIRSGDDWQKKLREAVRESDWFLLVMSPHSQTSDWLRRNCAGPS